MIDKELVIKCLENGNNYFPNIRKRLKVSKQELSNILDDLVKEGTVFYNIHHNEYYLIKKGTVEIKDAGYGFISVLGEEDDYYISKYELVGVYNGDTISFYYEDNYENHKEAYLIDVLKRAHTHIIGRYKETTRKGKTKAYIMSSDPKFPVNILVHERLELKPGTIVYGEINYEKNNNLSATIKEVLGHKDDSGIEISQIALEYGFETPFPNEVKEEIEDIADYVLEEETLNRVDYTNRTIITIDGDDSKDFDDAVSVSKNLDGSFNLGVYIADVSHYVKENSPLDLEAYKRGTSVYLADRVIPMLPRKLSNGICSLNEGVKRLVVACNMCISKEGNLINYEITEGVIKSKYRMTYNNVNKIINGDIDVIKQYEDLVPMINDMVALSEIIRKRRYKKGGIEFDVNEYKFSLNNDGSPKNIEVRSRDKAEMLIEDFMLEANETIAYNMNIKNLPNMYRVHEKPDQDKLKDVFNTIRNMGIELKQTKNDIHPKQVQEALEKIKNTDLNEILSNMLLRSMMKARYSEECLGHYGLAMNYYCHFTSPIRRYPDLIVHRLIKKLFIHPNDLDNDIIKYNLLLPEIAERTSISERKAVECERAVNDMLFAWYMEKHLFKEFDGVITSVTNFGMFVTLSNGVEGLVSLHNMLGFYYFDSSNMSYSNGKMAYKLGDKVKIVVIRADKKCRHIDFMFKNDYDKCRGDF